MNFRKFKLTKKKMVIIGIVFLVFLFWRRSYFMFTPDLSGLDVVELSELNENTRLNLRTYSEIREGSYSFGNTPWLGGSHEGEDRPTFFAEESKKGAIYGGTAHTYTSKEYGWKKTFNDYYLPRRGIIAYNDNYIVFFFDRDEGWYLFKDSPGSFFPVFRGGPPVYIYLMFNTAKIDWCDLFIVDRKTGKTKKKFRSDFVFSKAYLDESNRLYLRYHKNKTYFYQIE